MMRDTDLDDLFAAARAEPCAATPDLLARVLADAERLQPAPAALAPDRATLSQRQSRRGLWRWLGAGLGAGGLLAGMTTATLAGVWIGLAQPEPLTTVADALWQSTAAEDDTLETVDLIPSFDTFLTEG